MGAVTMVNRHRQLDPGNKIHSGLKPRKRYDGLYPGCPDRSIRTSWTDGRSRVTGYKDLRVELTDRFRNLNLYTCTLTLWLALLPMQSISQSNKSNNPGMNPQILRPCPDSPNCVSSRADAGDHFVDPLSYTGSGRVAFAKLKGTLANFPGARMIQSSDSYLHAEFRTRWLKFTDDFEALLDEQQPVIHMRSASRIGYWDLGTNRRRVETIRGLLEGQAK